jgi:UDP-GlcNAc3NAcA epimerase
MRLLTVVGARPQFVKAFPLNLECRRRGHDEVVVHTGQHFDDQMSEVFFRELDLTPPKHHLGIAGGGHGAMTGRMLGALEPVMEVERPDVVVVLGDTNSTLAGALAAAKLDLKVVHIEAGLRSFNRAMPEEINRVVADHLSGLRLCPTRVALRHLAAEGITSGVAHVGDLMFDATLLARALAERHARTVRSWALPAHGYAVATLHRAENTADAAILARRLGELRENAGELPVVFPVHPRTREAVARFGLDTSALRLVPPLGYLDMCLLVARAGLVLTDSGGLQKEAYFHGVPCVTLRAETEWTETVEHGWNRLVGTPDWRTPRRHIDDYGEGAAAAACLDAIEAWA